MLAARIEHFTVHFFLTCFRRFAVLTFGVHYKVPVVSCPHYGESYLTAETLHEIERIKLHRQLLAEQRSVPVAVFA